jgi:hypothetical protein
MDTFPPPAPIEPLELRMRRRDALLGRVSVMGQVTALLAMTSTGIVAGVFAHDAQGKDLLAARAAPSPVATHDSAPVAAPVVVRSKPLRTVLVPAVPTQRNTSSPRRPRRAAPMRSPRVTAVPAPIARRSAPVRPAPKAAAPATKTSGS